MMCNLTAYPMHGNNSANTDQLKEEKVADVSGF